MLLRADRPTAGHRREPGSRVDLTVAKTWEPDEWTVVVTDRMETPYWEFSGGMVDFVTAVLDGTVVCPIFTEDFPLEYPDEPIRVPVVGR